MRKLIYLLNMSLDGFVEGRDGKFDWFEPDDETHRFHAEQIRGAGVLLYGRRMYETMSYWHTIDDDAALPEALLEFARVWQATPKVVFSTTLEQVGDTCRLVRDNVEAEVTTMKEDDGGDLFVSGPGLASTLARLDLIDEYRAMVCPALVGGGKSYLPGVEDPILLNLVETRGFESGALYLRYRVSRG